MSLSVQVAGKTDVGCVRTNNEDNFGYDARYGIFLEAIAFHRPLRFFRLGPREVPKVLREGLTIEERLEDVRDRIINRLMASVDLKQPGVLPGWDFQRLRGMLDREIALMRQPITRLQFRPEEISVHPLMVWQPTAESMSLLYPFYQVNTPKRRIYVRVADAALFTDLVVVGLQRLGG